MSISITQSPTPLLGVNIDHVATLRQARGTRYPDPVQAAMVAEEGGADGITVHLREDRRHIQERDVHLLNETILTRLNLEMAVTKNMLSFVEKIRPTYCCLVPERREELTTEGGLDVKGQQSKIKEACQQLKEAGIQVSLFIDPDFSQIEASLNCQAPIIEIHTGRYADINHPAEQQQELNKIIQAVEQAYDMGLQVNAGHGLNYQNVYAIARINRITELNIGHGIVARSIFTGLKAAVQDMKHLMLEARAS